MVHELRFPSDPPDGDYTELPRLRAELPNGKNIPQKDGVWHNIYEDSIVSVSAGPIQHSVPSLGYVVAEAPVPGKMNPQNYMPHLKRTKTPMSAMRTLQQGGSITLSDGTRLDGPPRRPGRKIVILGDTCNPQGIVPIAGDADLLIHEATNAYLPGIDENTKALDSYQSVQDRTISRGHSTPQMAGRFAKQIGAKKLILNHFSSRYHGDDDVNQESKIVMDAIGGLAANEYGAPVLCARDMMSVDIDHRSKELD